MILANRRTSLPLVQAWPALSPLPTVCHSKTPIVHCNKINKVLRSKGFSLSEVNAKAVGRIRPPPDGLPRIRDRDRVDYGAESDRDGHDAAGAAEHRFRLPHYRRQPAADGAVDLPGRLRRRPVRDGPAVGPFRPPSSSARRHGASIASPACLQSQHLPSRRCCWRGRCRASAPRPPASSRPRSFAIATPDGAWRAWCRWR